MITKKTYIPGKPRNKKLTNVTSGAASVGKTEFNQVAGSSHEHPNKGILDQITEDMLNATLRDILTSIDDSIEPSDDNLMSSLRVLAEILKNNEDLKEVFLSKVEPDTAQGLITFLSGLNSKEIATLEKGLNVGNYSPGLLGSGGTFRMNDGVSELEVDKLLVRMRAEFFSVLIHNAKHIGGELIISAADMICIKVEEFSSFYRCYFDRGENNEVNNLFTNQDRARCQVFTGSGQKFYWRKVIAVGSDYIELSKTDASPGTNDIPAAGDHIFQLGSDDPDRQSAIILSSVGDDAPSWKQYEGIDSYSLEDKETTVFSSKGNRIQGKTVFTSGGTNLEDVLDGVGSDIQDAQAAANAAALKAQQAIDDAEANVGLINTEIGKLQAQIDGEVSNWFYPYSPTLANYPASDWTTNEIKDRHIGDTFTNTAQAPATDAGKSWRFVKNGSTYSWTQIADSDAVKALQQAAQAQATADGKSTTFLIQPSNYHLGDTWVLNADRTINGTAYKQGEILTATQDSTTFNEAHWLKRVRYTDDTAVDNLQIGGRNLILNSNNLFFTGSDYPSVIERSSADGIGKIEILQSNLNWNAYFQIRAIVSDPDFIFDFGAPYTLSVDVRASIANQSGDMYIRLRTSSPNTYSPPAYIYDTAGKWIRISTTLVIPENEDVTDSHVFLHSYENATQQGDIIEYRNWQLEKGSKATAYDKAPEDIKAEIDEARTEAETAAKAYADTKAEAERVLAEIYADGIVDAEEQARIDDVNAKLAAAKDYAEAQDALLKAQQEAYTDGKVTAAEQAAIDAANAYADLKKQEAEAYADGIVSDEEQARIAALQQTYNDAKAYAEQQVENLQIGGVNLLLNSEAKTWDKWATGASISSVVSKFGVNNWAVNTITDNTDSGFVLYQNYPISDVTDTMWKDKDIILSATVLPWNSDRNMRIELVVEYIENGESKRNYYAGDYRTTVNGETLVLSVKKPAFPSNLADIGVTYIRVILRSTSTWGVGDTFRARGVYLGIGNMVVDWTPSPQDIATAIADAQSSANAAQSAVDDLDDYIGGAFKDGVIDAAEAKAIEKYINSVNEIMSKAEASYNKVYANTYLEGAAKTNLLNAKINLWGQRDTLLSAINTAIAGGTTTPAQKTAVDNAFATFNSLMSAFQNAIEDANKAIQVKLDAISKGYVDDLQIGGRNLLRNSTFNLGSTFWPNSLTNNGTIIPPEDDKPNSYIQHFNYTNEGNNPILNSQRVKMKADGTEQVTVSFDIYADDLNDISANVFTLRRADAATGGTIATIPFTYPVQISPPQDLLLVNGSG